MQNHNLLTMTTFPAMLAAWSSERINAITAAMADSQTHL